MQSTSDAEHYLQESNEQAFDESGVDLTQIDWMLSMSPAERLQVLYETAASLAKMMIDADPD